MGKKDLKFWEFALLAVFVFTFILLMMWAAHLILPSLAHADLVQSDYNMNSNSCYTQSSRFTLTGYHGTITKVRIYALSGGRTSLGLGIWQNIGGTIHYWNTTEVGDYPGGNDLSAYYYLYSDYYGADYVEWNTKNITLSDSDTLYLMLYIWPGGVENGYNYNINTNQNWTGTCIPSGMTDMAFALYGTVGVPSAPTVSISSPAGTISAPPTSVSLLWTNPNATSTMNFTYSVWYGSSLLYSKFDYITDYSATSGTKTFELNYPFYNLMTYTEVATLNQSAPTSTSVSTTTTFYIQPPYYGGQSTTTATTTAIGGYAGTACKDPNVNFFVGFFCSIFIPQQATFSQWSNLQLALVNKPPLGYLTAISGVMSATSTATTSLDAITLPSGASSPFTIFRTSLLWLLWAIYGVYLFNRFRHLQI